MHAYFALFDNALNGQADLYQQYIHSRFFAASELADLDGCLQTGWRAGWHAVILADYEFGHPLQRLPETTPGHLVIHWFARHETVADVAAWLQQHAGSTPAGIGTPASQTGASEYHRAIHAIQQAIGRGDTYQINYTTRLHLNSYGCPIRLYQRLRQPVPHAVLACLPDSRQQAVWTLCCSPELFLDIATDGLITTKPMKGTAPILHDGHDQARAEALRLDPKNRAENIMIVDLLRNDLGKIATVGGVHVPEPFKVDAYGSVWQMTTAIEAQAKANTSLADIFGAAFPCGSITGAPKRMSMSIIRQLETSPRGLYTGSIGYLKPCTGGLGFHGTFNVVIRTLQLHPQADGTCHGVYGVGSGIVADSEAAAEYEECGWKARFLSSLRPEFGLFETVRVHNGSAPLLPLHLRRLAQAAAALNIPCPTDLAAQTSRYLAALAHGRVWRVKISLSPEGALHLESAVTAVLTTPQYVLTAPQTLPEHDYVRRFKTTFRPVYDRGWQQAEAQGAFDSLFFNTRGQLLEGGRSNVFVRLGKHWHTPALSLDILNGVMRQTVLANPQTYLGSSNVNEGSISYQQLLAADEIRLCNALRGMINVSLKP